MKYTKKILSVLMSFMMGFTLMTTPILAEQEPAGEEPEVTEKEEAEETETPAEEIEEPEEETPEVSEEPEEEPEVAEEPEETDRPAETPEIEEEKTEEQEAVEEEQEEDEPEAAEETPAPVTTVTQKPVTYNGVTVTVSYPSDAFGGKDVTLVVGEPGAAEKAALEKLGEYKAVDISFVDENGKEVQPADDKKVNVTLKAEGMADGAEAETVHVKGDGTVEILTAETEASNEVTKNVKIGETTKTVNVPAETKTVTVKDYKTVKVKVPAKYGYRYILKYKKSGKKVKASTADPILKKAKKDKNGKPVVKSSKYSVAKEKYLIKKAYTKTTKELTGTHKETQVIKEAYSYEVKEDVYADVTFSDVETSFTAESFSVYALVVVDEDGGIDFDETFGENHITVKAPAGAFEKGTIMKIEGQDDPEVLKNALKVLDDNTYRFNAVDISFWKDGKEVEPSLPVKVTWTSGDINAGDQLVHIKDDGTAELLDNAIVKDDKVTFTAESFSTYTTTRLDTIDLTTAASQAIVFEPSGITRPTSMPSGELSTTHPEIAGYTYVNATYQRTGHPESDDPVVYLGAFVYQEIDDDGNPVSDPVTYIYYRTESTAHDSDLIVKLASDETIHLNYQLTPVNVTYNVVFNGQTYQVVNNVIPDALKTALGSDADAFIVNGPASVPRNEGVPQAITVEIPRGYQATITRTGNSTLGSLGTEPTYSGDNSTITKTGELTLSGVYDFPSVNSNQTVTINLTKRNSFTFNASYFLHTKYTGGNTTTYGDYRISRSANARIYGDGTLNNNATKTFSADSVNWTFTTNNVYDSGKTGQNGDQWMVDSLEINGTTIEIPYANPGDSLPVSKTTTLPTGTKVTVSLTSIARGADSNNRTNYRRTYTISITNCYENIVISGGNIVDIDVSTEIIPEVLDNVNYSFYGYSTSDRAYEGTGLGWQNWGVGEPIESGARQSVASSRNYHMYGFNQTNNNAMRFSIPTGYYNPEIAFVTTTEGDLINYVTLGSGLSRGTKKDGYYPINGNPTNGYYYFRITDYTSQGNVSLLRLRASLKRYGVSYSAGTNPVVTNPQIPSYDYGGWYDDAHQQLKGYNVVDNTTIVLDKSAPTSDDYVFLYYTIDGDSTNKQYAPSQPVSLESVAQFAVYDDSKEEFVIPFVAHWEKKETSTQIPVTAHIFLDDEKKETVVTVVPERSSIYIDIDSKTMTDFMDGYNWQLFYDEVGSDPFIQSVDSEHNEVELRIYSKFYVYHSSTGKLELHTTKEMEYDDNGTLKIGKLNITSLTQSGYLYGGYYSDYLGAHEGNVASGANLVKAAADDNNKNGTLKTGEINALHEGKAVVINKEGVLGTVYNPKDTAGHVGYWPKDKAFTTEETTMAVADNLDWYSERKDTDTECIATGGTGTSIKVARAGIYYLKEVPNTYLRPTYMTTYQRWDKHLRDFFLISTTDDKNFTESGFVIGTAYNKSEVWTDKITITFGPNYDETVTDGVVDVDVNNTSKNKGGFVTAYTYFHLENESNPKYDGDNGVIGTKNVKPYWITLDGVTVTGAATRRITVKDKDGDNIIKVDPVDGEELKEITFKDIAAVIKAFVK